jgi:hypothetical protein
VGRGWKILLGVAVVIVIVALASADRPGLDRDGVPWQDYAPSVQRDVDALGAARDCSGLQRAFDTADANNKAMMDRTGHNNAELMGYILAKMNAAGCP